MPELPEVETTARGLRQHLVGRRLAAAGAMDWPRMLPNAAPEQLSAVLPGEVVEAVERRGKYLLMLLSSGGALALHRKMSGNLVLHPGRAEPARHTHLVLVFDDGRELHFVDPRKFGRIYYFEDRGRLAAFLDGRLGLEPLDAIMPTRLADLCRSSRRRLKSLLLDQRLLAGIGNLYADEALWAARLHPGRAASSLSRTEVRRLSSAIKDVLEQAIELRGTSLSDYVDADGAPGGNQELLKVYGRLGQGCPRCGRPIIRLVIAQRGTWLCPHCQRL